jgi:hypothetical protein
MARHNQICPCGSRRKAGRCCLSSSGTWFKSPSVITPALPRTGFKNPACYASQLEDCSRDLSKEHFVSESILKLLAPSGEVTVAGLNWQSTGETKSVPIATFASRVTCRRHNQALSPLDSTMAAVVSAIRLADPGCSDVSVPCKKRILVSGNDIERWLLKLVIGATFSNNALDKNAIPGAVEYLYGLREVSKGFGLHLTLAIDKTKPVTLRRQDLCVEFMSDAVTSTLLSVQVAIHGVPMWLVFDPLRTTAAGMLWRPTELILCADVVTSTILLSWVGGNSTTGWRFRSLGIVGGSTPEKIHWKPGVQK